jgi:hypothetical protein
MTYVDDLSDPVPEGQSRRGITALRRLMGRLKLTVNEEKTRLRLGEAQHHEVGCHLGTGVRSTT